MRQPKGIYHIKHVIKINSDRFYAGTSFIEVFPGISMSNKDGAASWCHNIVVAVSPKAMDHKDKETIMFFANKDGSLHFQKYESFVGMVDDYEVSEVPNSRLKGLMDVEMCMKQYFNAADGLHYEKTNESEFEYLKKQIVVKYPQYERELIEDCENIWDFAE